MWTHHTRHMPTKEIFTILSYQDGEINAIVVTVRLLQKK